MKQVEQFLSAFSNFMWGMPLVYLLVGGGLFFLIYSGFAPFKYLKHALNILRGKYDDPNDPGDINHFEALSSALAATVGMGNISGVAVAIFMGGPGALLWMWVSAFVGMATKFFTCTLAILYRGKDSAGKIQGGPMYVIREGLTKPWGESWSYLFKPLGVLFAIAGLFGPLPIFQANQLTQILRDTIYIPQGWVTANAHMGGDLVTGLILVIIVSIVIFGGITRIGKVTARVVPTMVVIYVGCVIAILAIHIEQIPYYLKLIVTDAFNGAHVRPSAVNGDAMFGGIVGSLIVIGIQRGVFSNEAGLGTEALAHGAAKTKEPVREGLVAMLGPAIDTIITCTMTALAILVTGVWKSSEANGVTLTLNAFNEALPTVGTYLLVICVIFFSISSMLTYSYYGTKCLGFLIGAKYKHWYNYFYVGSIIFGSVASIGAVIDLIDGMFALMAIPTMISAILLAPKAKEAAQNYFSRIDSFERND
ncbi:alanine or glycine:cation symporter, AGCS family [Fodinibius salinus]|uniref:Alanine or glycine:cation symporter, AGCS family n=1 Tax=Fodinibius salinus TaxID=860790 RepID=A0A5D3YM58_9BACT|nr:amino acid carrier protein [Fodinibius salinus]TYP93761.1 alanine or glycine:cation symporter, AGCS family [Fodinibius salinus]